VLGPTLLFIYGIVLPIPSAHLLVRGASSRAKHLSVSDIAIGLTVVAFGTSAPELVVNTISSYEDHSSIIFGNVIGSNIFNTLLILGIAGLIYPSSVQRNTVYLLSYMCCICCICFIISEHVRTEPHDDPKIFKLTFFTFPKLSVIDTSSLNYINTVLCLSIAGCAES
jgi:cation:H+ antiporter